MNAKCLSQKFDRLPLIVITTVGQSWFSVATFLLPQAKAVFPQKSSDNIFWVRKLSNQILLIANFKLGKIAMRNYIYLNLIIQVSITS